MIPLENKNRLWDLFNLFPLAMAVTDMKMARFIEVNSKFCELTQCTRKEIQDGAMSELGFYSENDRKRIIHELNLTGEINGLEKNFRLEDNSSVNTLMFARLISNRKDRYVLNIYCDVTEQKKLEAPAQQKEKDEAIVALVGGIAHEFNNALAGVLGNLELLEMELPDNEELKKYGEAMKASIWRMTRITDQLMAYAQRGKYQEETISLNDFIKDILPALNHAIDPSIRIDADFTEDTLYINADCSQIQTLLTNILVNASEAIEGGGKIRITTKEEEIDEEFAKINPDLKSGRYVCLTIEDEGEGMDGEIIKRIFEPFFTTKFHGRGLGMAAAYGIVRNHDGGISVETELGKGTKVHIYLPLADEGIREVKKPVAETAVSSGTIEALSTEVRELIERRREDRFKVVEGAAAIPEADYPKQAQIIDISRGGLAFWYNERENLTREFAELAITLAEEGFYLDKIPCKVISYSAANNLISLSHENLKRVGVQLGELTQKQTDRLEYFIRNYTTEL